MAKFIFKMQNILNIKYKLEEKAKQEYSEAMSNLTIEQNKLELLRKKRYELLEEYRKYSIGKLDFLFLKECQNSIKYTDKQIDNQIQQVRRRNKELELSRNKLNLAMQERKTQEKLKENQFEEFKQELIKEEMKEIDQLTSYRYNKSNNNN